MIFPDEVRLCKSSVPGAEFGVCAAQPIPPGTWIGPYEGQVVRQEDLREGAHNSFMWEVGGCFFFGRVSTDQADKRLFSSSVNHRKRE